MFNSFIQELNFLSDVAKKRRAEAFFALLFASLVILHLVYCTIHYEQTKFTNFTVVSLFSVEKEIKYIDYYYCYRQYSNMHMLTFFFIKTKKLTSKLWLQEERKPFCYPVCVMGHFTFTVEPHLTDTSIQWSEWTPHDNRQFLHVRNSLEPLTCILNPIL